MEVMEEEELAEIRAKQAVFDEIRNADLAEMERLEELNRRRRFVVAFCIHNSLIFTGKNNSEDGIKQNMLQCCVVKQQKRSLLDVTLRHTWNPCFQTLSRC